VRRPTPANALLALIVLALVACGGASGRTATAPPATERAISPWTTTAQSTVPAQTATATVGYSWVTYGGDSSRNGVVNGAPGQPRLRRRFARQVDGEIYAQPLIARNRIYVATEHNTVYAFTTSGKLAWKHHLGAPVAGGDLPCGNISPSGITGTPAIVAGRIYVVAFLGSSHRHVLFGLRLGSGGVAVRANVDPPNPLVQQERGALLAAHGRIYVPYGGLDGDCGPYHGWVVSRKIGGGGRIAYRNPSGEAGIWAPGGIAEQSGSLLVATGNGSGPGFGYANSVIRLSAGLHRTAFWAPQNWRALSSGDVDEGSLAPLPVSGGRVFQIGKDGVGYLLGHSLGGVGGQLHGAKVCGGGAFGADAFRAPFVVTPCGDALYGLHVSGGTFRIAWASGSGGRVPIIAGNSVFAIDRGGTLNQLRVTDGHKIASARVGSGATSFPAPAAAGHTLVAPAGDGFVVFSI
jgi:PQQ-like domain